MSLSDMLRKRGQEDPREKAKEGTRIVKISKRAYNKKQTEINKLHETKRLAKKRLNGAMEQLKKQQAKVEEAKKSGDDEKLAKEQRELEKMQRDLPSQIAKDNEKIQKADEEIKRLQYI